MNFEIACKNLAGHLFCRTIVGAVILFSATIATSVSAQTETPATEAPTGKAIEVEPAAEQELDATSKQRYKNFADLLSGSKFVGSFTVLGQKKRELSAEEYHIKSAEKMKEGNKWKLVARIKYGSYDLSVPIVLDVIWAGDTPVITLTDVNVPFMGSFSSRVVVYKGKYSGTWSHGEIGGHLFGTIERDQAEGVDVEKTKKEMDEKKKKKGDKKRDGSGSK